ncbi:MAG: twin-arginine translocase TatA/TatE family subunit [Myxococcota bacterium]|nr:twin-arginine translocase TatA/TatE family subunit [Myxococcota bacterium]
MFGLGWMEISFILVIALMVFGPKKLPELARKLGEGIREFKNASESFKATVNQEVHRPPPAEQPAYEDHDGPYPDTPAQLAEGKASHPDATPVHEPEFVHEDNVSGPSPDKQETPPV